MQVRLVGVAAVGRHHRGTAPGREEAGRVVEPHQPPSALGGQANLGPESRPQSLAAPASLGGQPLDPDSPPAGRDPPPGEGNLRIDGRAGLLPSGQRGLSDREPVRPRRGRAQLLLDPRRVGSPDGIEGHHQAA